MERIHYDYICDDCHNEWGDDQNGIPDQFRNGSSCPKCGSKLVSGYERGEIE